MAVRNINENEFVDLIHSGKYVLVDFWAPWCGYCRRIGPAYEKLAQQYGEQLHVVQVNIDQEPILANRERIEVIPTLVLYRDGEAVGSIVAPGSKAAIEEFLRSKQAI